MSSKHSLGSPDEHTQGNPIATQGTPSGGDIAGDIEIGSEGVRLIVSIVFATRVAKTTGRTFGKCNVLLLHGHRLGLSHRNALISTWKVRVAPTRSLPCTATSLPTAFRQLILSDVQRDGRPTLQVPRGLIDVEDPPRGVQNIDNQVRLQMPVDRCGHKDPLPPHPTDQARVRFQLAQNILRPAPHTERSFFIAPLKNGLEKATASALLYISKQ